MFCFRLAALSALSARLRGSAPFFSGFGRLSALNFNIPFLLLFLGVPFGMALLYLPMAGHYLFNGAGMLRFLREADSLHFLLGHIILLAFWAANTFAACLLLETLLAPFGPRWAAKCVPLVPALSYYLLLLIYAGAVVGYAFWGYASNYTLVLSYLGDLRGLFNTFVTPHPWLVPAVLAPLALLAVMFGLNSGGLFQALGGFRHYLRSGGTGRRWAFWAAFPASWLFFAMSGATGFSDWLGLGHFRNDPVAVFFRSDGDRFLPTDERRRWERKDRLAEKTLVRREAKARTVLLFVVDALRADHLGCYGYARPTSPFLDTLARRPGSRRVEWAFANASDTTTGVMSILASKEPKAIGLSNYTLPDYFHDHGFTTHLILAGDHRWYRFNRFYGRRIDDFTDGTQASGPGGMDDDRALLRVVDRLAPDDGGRHFFYFHLMSVHELGYLQGAYRRWEPQRELWGFMMGAGGAGEEAQTRERINRYDNGVLQADDVVRQVLEKLREKGYLESYTAVLTADHGQALGEKGRFGHLRFADLGLLRVPLLFFGNAPAPGFPDRRFAVQLDIAPTMADWAGLEIPSTWQGQPLTRPRTGAFSWHFTPSRESGNEGAVVYYQKGRLLKYSRKLTGAGGEAVYDPLRDPAEKNNLLADQEEAFLRELRRQADEHFTQN
jgi:hypothetical protein